MGQNYFGDLSRLYETGHADAGFIGFILDDGQIATSETQQRVDQRVGRAWRTKAAEHDRCAVLYAGQRFVQRHGFV